MLASWSGDNQLQHCKLLSMFSTELLTPVWVFCAQNCYWTEKKALGANGQLASYLLQSLKGQMFILFIQKIDFEPLFITVCKPCVLCLYSQTVVVLIKVTNFVWVYFSPMIAVISFIRVDFTTNFQCFKCFCDHSLCRTVWKYHECLCFSHRSYQIGHQFKTRVLLENLLQQFMCVKRVKWTSLRNNSWRNSQNHKKTYACPDCGKTLKMNII